MNYLEIRLFSFQKKKETNMFFHGSNTHGYDVASLLGIIGTIQSLTFWI